MNVPIKVINNFLNTYECKSMVEHIDLLEDEKPEEFLHDPRIFMEFGKNLEQIGYRSESDIPDHVVRNLHTLDVLSEEMRTEIVLYFKRAIEEIKKQFKYTDELYVSEFRVTKYYPGVTVTLHSDNDEGLSDHLKYSSIIYMNTMTLGGGELSFSDHNYIHHPKAGDLIIFPCLEGGYHEVKTIHETRYSIAMWCTDRQDLALY